MSVELQFASNEEIIKELQKRYKVMIFSGTKLGKKKGDKDLIDTCRSGSLTTSIGLVRRLDRYIDDLLDGENFYDAPIAGD